MDLNVHLIILPRNPHIDVGPERIFLHNKYDHETLEFDIALVKMNPVKFTSHIKPISLPGSIACGRNRKRRKKKRRRKGSDTGKRRSRRNGQKGRGRRSRNPFLKKGVRRMRQIRKSRRRRKQMRKRLEEEYDCGEDGSGNSYQHSGSGSGREECNIEEEERGRVSWSFPSFIQPPGIGLFVCSNHRGIFFCEQFIIVYFARSQVVSICPLISALSLFSL